MFLHFENTSQINGGAVGHTSKPRNVPETIDDLVHGKCNVPNPPECLVGELFYSVSFTPRSVVHRCRTYDTGGVREADSYVNDSSRHKWVQTQLLEIILLCPGGSLIT